MIKNYFFALSLGLGGVLWATQNAHAQPNSCAERAMVVERLEGSFGETRQSVGIGQNNAVVEIFASQTTGTWTIVVSLPNGLSCLVASGESWEQLVVKARVPGNDA